MNRSLRLLFLLISFLSLALLPLAAADFDRQEVAYGVGNWTVLTVGGYTFTRPFSFDLAPTNLPKAVKRATIRCQIVYENEALARPADQAEFEFVLAIGDQMNASLADWLSANGWVGRDYAELVAGFADDSLRFDLQDDFAKEVQASFQERGLDLRVVSVLVEAEGDLARDLARYDGAAE